MNEDNERDLFLEYETIRRSGKVNMLDRRVVQALAAEWDMYALASLAPDEYFELLTNYQRLNEFYGSEFWDDAAEGSGGMLPENVRDLQLGLSRGTAKIPQLRPRRPLIIAESTTIVEWLKKHKVIKKDEDCDLVSSVSPSSVTARVVIGDVPVSIARWAEQVWIIVYSHLPEGRSFSDLNVEEMDEAGAKAVRLRVSSLWSQ